MKIRRGFTLVELLVVIAIITLLVGILVPSVQAVRESGRRVACANRLKQISLAMHVHERHHGRFPAARFQCDGYPGTSPYDCLSFKTRRSGRSGFVSALPFLEELVLYDTYATSFVSGGLWPCDDSAAWRTPAVVEALKSRPPVLVCPSDSSDPLTTEMAWVSDNGSPIPTAAVASYVMCHGHQGPRYQTEYESKYRNTGLFRYVFARQSAEVVDGLSNTFMIGESVDNHLFASRNIWTHTSRVQDSLRSAECPPNGTRYGIRCSTAWPYGTGPLEYRNGDFSSRHPQGLQFAMGDGRVVFVDDMIRQEVYRALATVNSATSGQREGFVWEKPISDDWMR